MQQDVKDVLNAASGLQKLQVVGLHAYWLHNGIVSIEPMVELPACTLCSDVFA
jgi:hypothetical protein